MNDIYMNADKLLKDLFDKYNDKEEDLLDKVDLTKSLTKRNMDIEVIFNKLEIVTMTLNAYLPFNINYYSFKKIFIDKLGKEDFIFIETIKYKEDKTGKVIILGKQTKESSQFYNSFTLTLYVNKTHKMNLKYFRNGSIQITGCKNIKDIEKVIMYIVDIVNKNKELMICSIEDKELIMRKNLDKNKVKELKSIATTYGIVNLKKYKKQTLIQEIINSTNYYKDYILPTIKYNEKNINKFKIEDSNIKISMINCSYAIKYILRDIKYNFEIDRNKLFKFIKENTKLHCYYDNNQHQGVKINYMYNSSKTGICNCKEQCIIKKKTVRSCKKITILLFNSGKIIITGSNSIEQSQDAYNLINKLIENNYNDIIQTSVNS